MRSRRLYMRLPCLLALALLACSAVASSARLELSYLRLPASEVTEQLPGEIIDPPTFDRFSAIEPRFNLGYTRDRIWLRMLITNPTAEFEACYLTTGQRYLRPLLIYERVDGVYRRAYFNDADQPFGNRPLPLPNLTFPIELDPHESREYLAYIGSGGELAMNMELREAENVRQNHLSKLATTLFFEGVLVTLIIINLFYYRAVRRPAHLYYALQEVMIGLYIAHMEGLAFQYIWPDLPMLNSYATRILGHGGNISILLFGIAFLDLARTNRSMYRLSWVLLAIPVSFLLLLPFIDANLSNRAGLYGASMSAVFLLFCGVQAVVRGERSAVYFLLGWLSLGFGIILFAMGSFGIIPPVVPPLFWVEIGTLGEAFVLLLGLFDQIRRINEERNESREALVLSLEARLKEARRTMEAEQQREATRRALADKEKLLRMTSHDVSQPIYALRLALVGMAQKPDDARLLESMNRTLDHMEDVLHQGLSADESVSQSLPSTWGELFRQVVEDHRGEAQESAVELRFGDSSLELGVPIVPIRRVLNNLVANAIRHAEAKRILLGLRRGAHLLAVHVIDDGIGLDRARTTSVTSGTGLGIAIIRDICANEGWRLQCGSGSGQGTHYTIEIEI